MPLDCYIDFIGIYNGMGMPPVNQRYINSQPGITLELIEAVQEREKPDTVTLWQTIQQRALVKFGDRYQAAMYNKYSFWCAENEGCGLDEIACAEKERFASAWMNILCSELMIEVIYSTRMNRFTTIDEPQAEALKAMYDVDFERTLNSAVKNLPRAVVNKCVSGTKSRVYYKEQLP